MRTETPPERPRLTLRVGATGHRPGHKQMGRVDEPLLRKQVRTALQRIADAAASMQGSGTPQPTDYSPDPLCLRLLSALAEGADRIIAEEALALKYDLQVALPFSRDEYENDFTEASSKTRYRYLLNRATAVLELDGERANAAQAYQRAGRVLLGQCDVVIAIWDGEPANGVGGTGQVVLEAMVRGLPVIWIRSQAPHDCVVLPNGAEGLSDAEPLARIHDEVLRVLAPIDDEGGLLANDYFAARPARHYLPPLYKWMRGILAPQSAEATPTPPAITDGAPVLPSAPTRDERDWSDARANRCAAAYRDAFVAIYGLGAVAVACALLGYVFPLATKIELVSIVFIIFIAISERHRHWQERWIYYRMYSERLRQFEILWPIGRVLTSFHPPAHAMDVASHERWVDWLFRARLRESGLVSAKLQGAYLETYRRTLLKPTVDEQVRYHETTAGRSGQLERWLKRIAAALFVVTLGACFLHVADSYFELPLGEQLAGQLVDLLRAAATPSNAIFTLVAAVAPAFGAAAAGIAGQAELARIERRSGSMRRHLLSQSSQLGDVNAPVASDGIAAIAENVCQVMTEELFDWRATFSAKEIDLA